MKRLIIGGLSVLLISTTTALSAEAATKNTKTFSNAITTTRAFNGASNKAVNNVMSRQLTPSNLVFLAYQGYFRSEGVPSYNGLIAAYHTGRITAKDIVQSAVTTNRLSSDTLNAQDYISYVEAKLRALSVD